MALADKAHLIADAQADKTLAVALAQSAVQYQLDLLQEVSDAAQQRLVRDQNALYDFRVARANADLAWRTAAAAAGKQFVDGTAPAVQGFEGCTPSSMGRPSSWIFRASVGRPRSINGAALYGDRLSRLVKSYHTGLVGDLAALSAGITESIAEEGLPQLYTGHTQRQA